MIKFAFVVCAYKTRNFCQYYQLILIVEFANPKRGQSAFNRWMTLRHITYITTNFSLHLLKKSLNQSKKKGFNLFTRTLKNFLILLVFSHGCVFKKKFMQPRKNAIPLFKAIKTFWTNLRFSRKLRTMYKLNFLLRLIIDSPALKCIHGI